MLIRSSLIKFRAIIVQQDPGKLFSLHEIETACGLSKVDVQNMICHGVIQRPAECSDELLFTPRELIGALNAALELIRGAGCEIAAGACGGCDE